MRAPITGLAVRMAACLALLVLMAAPLAGSAAAKVNNSHLSAKDRADLAKVSHYLNTLPPLKGRFKQVSVEPAGNSAGGGGRTGHAKGTFYLQQPGRMRFEYDPPQQVLFISDGRFVTVEDKELESVDNYPLSKTPLHLLLKGDLNLIKDAQVVAVHRTPGWLQVTARKDNDRDMSGQLTMTLSWPKLDLVQWTVIDSKETRTTVTLRDVKRNVKLRPGLFRATDYDFEAWD